MAPLPEIFGPYRLLRRIGSGGMAEIFYATALQGEGGTQDVAIKRVHRLHLRDPWFRHSFSKEVQLLAALRHPNISRMLHGGEEQDHLYLVLEYIPGENLKRIIDHFHQRGEKIPLFVILFLMIKLCAALYYIYFQAQGENGEPLRIVHRDINPHNIIISYHGEIKLIDFGIAQSILHELPPEEDLVQGKIGYMTPEHFLGKPLDHRSDIFSCGTLFYELLTGTRLFKSDSYQLTKQKILQGAPPLLSAPLDPELARQLQPIFSRAMAVAMDQRYGSAMEMAADLEQLAQKEKAGATEAQMGTWLRGLFRQRRQRRA
jgi:serine/threonine-protein kinase